VTIASRQSSVAQVGAHPCANTWNAVVRQVGHVDPRFSIDRPRLDGPVELASAVPARLLLIAVTGDEGAVWCEASGMR